jgi:transposase
MKRNLVGLVPIPEKKVTYKKAVNGTVYVYLTIRAYRNSKGKPTSDEVSIGKKDTTTGMLIPNSNYFDYFPDSIPVKEAVIVKDVKSYGNKYALMELSQSEGLVEILQNCFPQKWMQLLVCAFYMVCEGNVMMYLDDWLDVTEVSPLKSVDSKRVSELFASISYSERLHFFSEWVSHRSEQEYIAYDVTSISTYSKGIDFAEWGYNRDGEALAQLNLGMYYGVSSHLPVYYNVYSGSVTDKSHLVFMLDNADKLGIKKIKFVLDRGFVTEENLKYMSECSYPFIVPLPSARVDTIKLIESVHDKIRSSENWLEGDGLYAFSMDYELYGFKTKVHIFFNTNKSADEEKHLYANIFRLESELKKLKKSKRMSKRYTDYFDIENEGSNDIRFELNHGKINERLKRVGFFVFLTTDLDATAREVIHIYRSRDVIEKSFDCLKNELDFSRMRTHVNSTTEGKAFVGFIALILRSLLMNKIRENKDTAKFTTEKVILELKKIRAVTLNDGKRVLMPLTKTQKKILMALGLTENIIKKDP